MTVLAMLAAEYATTVNGRGLAERSRRASLLDLSHALQDADTDLHDVLCTDAVTDDEGNLRPVVGVAGACGLTEARAALAKCAALLEAISARIEAVS